MDALYDEMFALAHSKGTNFGYTDLLEMEHVDRVLFIRRLNDFIQQSNDYIKQRADSTKFRK